MACGRKHFLLVIWLSGPSILFSNPLPLPCYYSIKSRNGPISFLYNSISIIYDSGTHTLFINTVAIFFMLPFQLKAIPKSNEQKNGPKRQKNGMWARWIGIVSDWYIFLKRNFSLKTESNFPRVGHLTLLRRKTPAWVSNLHSRPRSQLKIFSC